MIRMVNLIETKWFVVTLFLLASITVLSLWPPDQLPAVPGSDKTHHLIAYALLMFPTALKRPKNREMIGLFFIAYSGVIELLQPYVNRHGEWLDMAANATGIVCGLLFAELITYIFRIALNRSH